MDNDIVFPKVNKSITDFLYEEEGNISREKVMFIGSLLIIIGTMLRPETVFAGHKSHASHASHVSSSHSSGHESHASHASHTSSTSVPHSSAPAPHSSTPAPHSNAPAPAPVVQDPIPQVPQIPSSTPLPD